MRIHPKPVAFVVFPVAACAVLLTIVFLGFAPSKAVAGGKDPSINKPMTRLTCEELRRAYNAAAGDMENLNKAAKNARFYNDNMKVTVSGSQHAVDVLEKDIATEKDSTKKKELKTRLKVAKKDFRKDMSDLRGSDHQLKTARLAIDQNIKRREAFQKKMREKGC